MVDPDTAIIPAYLKTAEVYQAMGRHPALLAAWAPLRAHVVTQNSLGPFNLEIVILRAAHGLDAPYEWAHHVLRGRRAGLEDRLIAALSGPIEGLTGDVGLLARAVDTLVEGATLPPEVRESMIARFGMEATLDLMATVGFYATLAFIVKTFEVPLDEDVVQGLEAAPLGGK